MPLLRLHSKYNPHKEAEQFAATIDGHPFIIVITEPGESYLAAVLKKKFPQTKCIAIRYTDSLFLDSDALWDIVWRPSRGSLPFFLLSHIADEKLASTRFLSWKAADKAFPQEATAIWQEIRHAIELLTSVMRTRSFFGNRWLTNTFHNFTRLSNAAAIGFGTRDFILAGAGPSLQQLTASHTAPYSIVAVSSAYHALAARDINTHLCLSTDAGYWALRLFDGIPPDIPIAFPLEAAIPASILERNPCIPLSYGSPLETALFTASGLVPLTARENGTVTGTACELLLMHTPQKIVLAGVDLTASKGFIHAQPHPSELRNDSRTDRFHPLAQSLAVQNFHSQSLETYRQWFLQLPSKQTRRLFRAGTGGCALPNIRAIDLGAAIPNKTARAALSIQPSSAASGAERIKITAALLRRIRGDLATLITDAPESLTGDTVSLEKQICALCSYTAYCNFIKTPFDTETQLKLQKQVDSTLGALIKRIAP